MNNVERAARAERVRAEEMYAHHRRLCVQCYRFDRDEGEARCGPGQDLAQFVRLMTQQEAILMEPADQDGLW